MRAGLRAAPLRRGARQVFCNGEEVLTVSGTKKEYVVDVWSGNHPFYLARAHPALPQLHTRPKVTCTVCGC